MSTIVNKYQGTCLTCHQVVDPQKGYAVKVDGRWSIFCASDVPGGARDIPARASIDPTIELRWVDGRVQIKPAGFLGSDLFQSYLAACGGATYRKDVRANYAGPDLVGSIVTRLAQAGFKLDTDPQVTAAVQAWEAKAKADTNAAVGRAAEINATLQARGLALFPFQNDGVSWLAPLDRAILADDQGLGKTVQTSAALPEGAPVVVVAPAVAKGVWARELAKWRPDLKVTMLSGRGSFRWPTPGEVIVTNFDITADAPLDVAERGRRSKLEKTVEDLRKSGGDPAREIAKLASDDAAIALFADAPHGLCVVIDEAHAVKGSPKKVARSARCKALCNAAFEHGGRAWLLTGTPLENKPTDLWALLSLIRAEKVVFGSYNNFKSLCGGYNDGWGTKWSASGIDTSVGGKLRQVMLRRLKVDVLTQLPAKIVEVVDVELDASSIRRLDEIVAELEAQGIDLMAAIRAAKANDSIAFDQIARARKILATAKAGAAMDMADDLEEQGQPVLVFSAHRDPIDVLAKRAGWAAITGDTPPADRTLIEEKFQRGELKGIAATIKAAGVAITLTRACNAIFIDSEWNPSKNVQAEDRIYRIGQANACTIQYLRANHKIDERVYELCEIKRGMVARTVDAAAHRDGPLSPRSDAASALEASRASQDASQRQIDAETMADRVRRAREQADAGEVRRKAAIKTERANHSRGWKISPALFETAPRAAQNAREEWAVQALGQLTSSDGDHAFEENGVGFNKADTFIGHALAPAAVAGQLNDGEWLCAIELLRKYQGQVGAMP